MALSASNLPQNINNWPTGDTVTMTATVTQGGLPVDLSGATASEFGVYQSHLAVFSSPPLIAASLGDGITVSGVDRNILSLRVQSGAIKTGSYYAKWNCTLADGTIFTVAAGNITFV